LNGAASTGRETASSSLTSSQPSLGLAGSTATSETRKGKKIVIPGQHHKTIHVSSWFHLSEDFEAGRNADKNQQNAYIIEGSLEVKLPTIWTDEKQSREEAKRRER